ncbi:MAG: histidine--tRNA ligase [candidate division WOR-3 bacterium]|nr:histidine--tRNA ligase [candidate division WOR-3 bacterium]
MIYQRPRGTRDIYGDELERIELINRGAREFFKLNGFTEIRTPTFESIELFVRSIGLHTDIVEKEMYTFEHDKKMFVLRPEGTASVLRAVLENGLKPPCRLLYIGQMFRKERPQKGRYREFQQIGVELIGEAAPFYDAECINLAVRFLDTIGATHYFIELNSIGCPVCRQSYKNMIENYLKPYLPNLCSDCQRRFEKNFLRIFDCKKDSCQKIYEVAPKITDNLCEECGLHYQKTKEFLKKFNINFEENKKLVRGLDYYTRTVFEFKLKGLGAQDTIIAGGRYDLLVKELGGDNTPCIGWAMGVERMLLALPELQPEIKKSKKFFIAVIGESLFDEGVKLREMIIKNGFICIHGNPLDKIKTQMKDAHHYKVDYVIIYGEDEAAQGVYTLKNMMTGEQKKISQNEIIQFIEQCQ